MFIDHSKVSFFVWLNYDDLCVVFNFFDRVSKSDAEVNLYIQKPLFFQKTFIIVHKKLFSELWKSVSSKPIDLRLLN